ncbi:hypothetical protein RJZ56_007849 [Blastomyces dermatitidis]|uniref:PPPDE domain-containing protein n=1 Tax=Ajellomyces dermatitidis (strain ER-3 / ATCC MYA-2586) TaxID=559297 RepID=A0ABP2EMH3_AJEDR|nr:uncharacterized protein BDCG_01371 [Blastomyces dermatitidis ER-3]EEQ84566.1 hypothetical protein BDCG_01371 [Blastomyces dermatitidis ER-3]EQL28656.1 hypothetical protein BDFG_08630 [Blastomyces dermatitidis ATCC 26199]
MSSILSASSQTLEYAPQTLHLVAFGIGDIAHWALFIPNRTADPTGTLVHIGIEGNDAKSGGGEAELLINQFQLSRSSAKSVVPLVGSRATRGEVEDAARACFESFDYNILLDNCQTFTIDVLTELRRRLPSQIQQASINLIREQYGTTPVKIQQFLDRHKQQQNTEGHQPESSEPRFSLD